MLSCSVVKLYGVGGGWGMVNQNTLDHSALPLLSCWELPGWYPSWCWWTRAHMDRSVRDLCRHVHHFYCTILSHTANCCGCDNLNWTASCITPNISHPPCCQLAQVVALSSPPFSVKPSVWLPPSCNAAPLIAKATTQMKKSGLPSAHHTLPETVLLSSQQTGFVECTAAEGVSSWGQDGFGEYVSPLGWLSNDLMLGFSSAFEMCVLERNVFCSLKGTVNDFGAVRQFTSLLLVIVRGVIVELLVVFI